MTSIETVKMVSQSFLPAGIKIVLIVFYGGIYVGENTESDG